MIAFRHLTLVWPGLPWLWLRGSVAGLVLALAFAVSFDVAVVTTFIWPDLVELPLTLAIWTAIAVVWLVSTVSAAAAFPPALARPPAAEVDPLLAGDPSLVHPDPDQGLGEQAADQEVVPPAPEHVAVIDGQAGGRHRLREDVDRRDHVLIGEADADRRTRIVRPAGDERPAVILAGYDQVDLVAALGTMIGRP
jgi:hypothetical protein